MSSDYVIGFDGLFVADPFFAVETVTDDADIGRLYPEIVVVVLPADAPEIARSAGRER